MNIELKEILNRHGINEPKLCDLLEEAMIDEVEVSFTSDDNFEYSLYTELRLTTETKDLLKEHGFNAYECRGSDFDSSLITTVERDGVKVNYVGTVITKTTLDFSETDHKNIIIGYL